MTKRSIKAERVTNRKRSQTRRTSRPTPRGSGGRRKTRLAQKSIKGPKI